MTEEKQEGKIILAVVEGDTWQYATLPVFFGNFKKTQEAIIKFFHYDNLYGGETKFLLRLIDRIEEWHDRKSEGFWKQLSIAWHEARHETERNAIIDEVMKCSERSGRTSESSANKPE